MTSAGDSSPLATSIPFVRFGRAGKSGDVLYLAEADAGLVTIPVASLGKDCDSSCGAGAGAESQTSGMGTFGASLVLLARGVGSGRKLFFALVNVLSRRSRWTLQQPTPWLPHGANSNPTKNSE